MNNSTYEEQLALHGQLVYTNVGDSMMPLLRENRDLMVISRKNPGRMKKYDAKTKEEAEKIILDDKENLQKIAEECVKLNGSSDSVAVELTRESYPTREYESFTLPAGEYTSLKVIIGRGEGQNWWCVLFPEICLGAATDFDKALSDKSEKVVTNPGKHRVKFKVVELYHGIREKINSIF